MVVVGIILLLIGWLTGISILWILGVIALVVGLILLLVGSRRPADYAGRRYWY
jgi:hypothetical protein